VDPGFAVLCEEAEEVAVLATLQDVIPREIVGSEKPIEFSGECGEVIMGRVDVVKVAEDQFVIKLDGLRLMKIAMGLPSGAQDLKVVVVQTVVHLPIAGSEEGGKEEAEDLMGEVVESAAQSSSKIETPTFPVNLSVLGEAGLIRVGIVEVEVDVVRGSEVR
jgi:hypothetical protein